MPGAATDRKPIFKALYRRRKKQSQKDQFRHVAGRNIRYRTGSAIGFGSQTPHLYVIATSRLDSGQG